ncbi:MAG: YciC family protein [Pseudomonadota bacterium]
MKAGHGRTKLDVRIGEIAGRYADLVMGHWRTLLALFGIGWALFALVGYGQDTLLGWTPNDFLTFFDFDVIPVAFVTAATAHAVLWGRPGAGLRGSLDVALRAFGSMLVVTVLVRFAIILGIAFLILPGLAVAILLSLAAVILMAERPGMFASLLQSVQMVLSALGKVIGSYVIYLLSLVGVLFAGALVSAFATINMPEPWSQHISFGALSAALSISHTVFAVAVYQVLTEARSNAPEPTVH